MTRGRVETKAQGVRELTDQPMTRGRVETNLSFYILVMPAAWFVWEGSSSFDGGLL